jgi:hypothetical protein
MKKNGLTETQQAQELILNSQKHEFELTLHKEANSQVLEIVLHYFQAIGQISRKQQVNKNKLADKELINYKTNEIRLENLKNEIFNTHLPLLLEKYNEAIIMAGLVQLIRDNEASNLNFKKYLIVRDKFFDWPKYGIKNSRILLAWKNFSNAIKEVEEWLTEKKFRYLPILEQLVGAFEKKSNITSEELFQILKILPEKECFYLICNILLTNPILRKEFLTIALMEASKLIAFERVLFSILEIILSNTRDNSLKGLILLFKQQTALERKELL